LACHHAADGRGEVIKPVAADELAGRREADEPLYVLGVAEPEDSTALGDVSSYVWRFACLDGGQPPTSALLAFTSMRLLMAFTREVNLRQPFSVPTESAALAVEELGRAGQELALLIDPQPDDFTRLQRAGWRLRQRRIPQLYG
jgi:hypothetical protein